MVAQIDRQFAKFAPAKIWARILAYSVFEGRPLTTRGRWVNPLVFLFYRVLRQLPLHNGPDDPVFILGVGRSGTTVLGKILATHPDVGFLNEPKALWHSALGDDDIIGSYSDRPGRYRMDARDVSDQKARRLRISYRVFLFLSGGRRVVDKYPELIFRNGLTNSVFPKTKNLILVRDGIDVCRSIKTWSEAREKTRHGQCENWWGRDHRKWHTLLRELVPRDPMLAAHVNELWTLRRPADMAALEWAITMREAIKLIHENPDQNMLVRYEELVSDPATSLLEIFKFTGMSLDHRVVDYANSVLTSRPQCADISLHPAVQPVFYDTMARLGYQQRAAA